MKIYTKKGDDGTTALLGGTRLPKHHIRIETYGTVDELNSFVGLLRDNLNGILSTGELIKIQEELFSIGSHLAADPDKNKMSLPLISEQMVLDLENAMDLMEAGLPEMKFFVLPGGHVSVSHAHICRCVCRRAERLCVALSEMETVEPLILKYLNRLSDYFFVLSRRITQLTSSVETPWNPNSRS